MSENIQLYTCATHGSGPLACEYAMARPRMHARMGHHAEQLIALFLHQYNALTERRAKKYDKARAAKVAHVEAIQATMLERNYFDTKRGNAPPREA